MLCLPASPIDSALHAAPLWVDTNQVAWLHGITTECNPIHVVFVDRRPSPRRKERGVAGGNVVEKSLYLTLFSPPPPVSLDHPTSAPPDHRPLGRDRPAIVLVRAPQERRPRGATPLTWGQVHLTRPRRRRHAVCYTVVARPRNLLQRWAAEWQSVGARGREKKHINNHRKAARAQRCVFVFLFFCATARVDSTGRLAATPPRPQLLPVSTDQRCSSKADS